MPNQSAPNYVAQWVLEDTPSRHFIWRGPGSREMNFATVSELGDIVPNDRFYVHNRALPPSVNAGAWSLAISGDGVTKPRSFSYAELTDPEQFEPVTIRRVLDCGANGRSFFPKLPPPGSGDWLPVGFTEWQYGTMGAADWTGVRLRDVLERCGLSGAVEIMLTGLDQIMVQADTGGAPFMAHYQHLIPIPKALEDDTLLVYRMNGETLPVDHGYPLRAFFSGWGGNTAVKWLGAIEASRTKLKTPITQVNQILTGPAYQPKVVPTKQNPKSAFELAWGATLMATTSNAFVLSGRAWSADATITCVDVRIERHTRGGWEPVWSSPEWRSASFTGTPQPKTWVRFTIPWEAEPGEYRLSCRATDDQGSTQPAPEDVPWNQLGLHYNGYVRHPVQVLPMSTMP
jgi:DMSO/TMAO reductase YedYZ molybdopterin-dependent catalytic subunit